MLGLPSHIPPGAGSGLLLLLHVTAPINSPPRPPCRSSPHAQLPTNFAAHTRRPRPKRLDHVDHAAARMSPSQADARKDKSEQPRFVPASRGLCGDESAAHSRAAQNAHMYTRTRERQQPQLVPQPAHSYIQRCALSCLASLILRDSLAFPRPRWPPRKTNGTEVGEEGGKTPARRAEERGKGEEGGEKGRKNGKGREEKERLGRKRR